MCWFTCTEACGPFRLQHGVNAYLTVASKSGVYQASAWCTGAIMASSQAGYDRGGAALEG